MTEHLVDRRTHRTDLGPGVGVPGGHPDGQIDLAAVQRQRGDLAGGGCHALQWAHRPADEEEDDQAPEQQRSGHHQTHDQGQPLLDVLHLLGGQPRDQHGARRAGIGHRPHAVGTLPGHHHGDRLGTRPHRDQSRTIRCGKGFDVRLAPSPLRGVVVSVGGAGCRGGRPRAVRRARRGQVDNHRALRDLPADQRRRESAGAQADPVQRAAVGGGGAAGGPLRSLAVRRGTEPLAGRVQLVVQLPQQVTAEEQLGGDADDGTDDDDQRDDARDQLGAQGERAPGRRHRRCRRHR